MELVKEQLALASTLYNDIRFRQALLVIWTASFGGALHAPVTTFFYRRLGAADTDIGWIGVLISIGSLVLAPIWGLLSDRYGAFPVIWSSCFLCALGCLIRGLAPSVAWLFVGGLVLGLGAGNLWTSVMGYLASNSPPERRSAVISSFLVQIAVLRIVGKLSYPFWHHLLVAGFGFEEGLLMDRVSMGVCTAFCFYGTISLLYAGKPIRDTEAQRLNSQSVFEQPLDHESKDQEQSQMEPLSGSSSAMSSSIYICFGLVLVLQAVCCTVTSSLWPLYLADVFDWTTREYSIVLLISSFACTAGVSAVPFLERRMSSVMLAMTCCAIGAGAALFAFSPKAPDMAAIGANVVLTVVLLTVLAVVEPTAKGYISRHTSLKRQATSFGGMAMTTGIGEMVGSYTGTHLYTLSAQDQMPVASFGIQGAAVPFAFVAVCLVTMFLLLLWPLSRFGGSPSQNKQPPHAILEKLIPRRLEDKTA